MATRALTLVAALALLALASISCAQPAPPATGGAAQPTAPAAAKPAEAKPAEAKPAEAKPAEAKPAAPAAPAAKAKTGNTLIIASAGLPSSLEQDKSLGYPNQEATQNMGATLIRNPYVPVGSAGDFRQDVSKFEPLLAESYQVSNDGLTYTFKLKQGVKSHAGNELTAEDVRYSLERKISTKMSSAFVASQALTRPDQFKVIDKYTASVTLDVPYRFTLLSLLANQHIGSIYDSTVLKANATAQDPWATAWADRNDYGFGPYKLVEFTPGQQIVWQAHDGYVLGKPPIDRVVVRDVPESSTRVALLRAGDVHVAEQLRPRELATLANTPGIRVPSMPTNMYVFMSLNTKMPPFDNKLVRQALAHAIPYDRILQDVYLGKGVKAEGPITPGGAGYGGGKIPSYKTDPARAKELLTQAGFPNGVEGTLSIDLSYPDLQEAANIIRTGALEGGIRLTINPMPLAAYIENKFGGKLQLMLDRDYSIVQSPPYQLLLFFEKGSPLNWPQFVHEEFLSTIRKGIAVGDEQSDQANEFWLQAQRTLMDEMPMQWINYVEPLLGVRQEVTGYSHRTDNILPYERFKFVGQ
jgi:peptide/nickel transport system substrate-binding protein